MRAPAKAGARKGVSPFFVRQAGKGKGAPGRRPILPKKIETRNDEDQASPHPARTEVCVWSSGFFLIFGCPLGGSAVPDRPHLPPAEPFPMTYGSIGVSSEENPPPVSRLGGDSAMFCQIGFFDLPVREIL